MNDLAFDNSALNALNEEFAKVVELSKTHNMGLESGVSSDRVLPYSDSRPQHETIDGQKEKRSRVGVKMIKIKGRNDGQDQHHIVVPMKLMTGDFSTTTHSGNAN